MCAERRRAGEWSGLVPSTVGFKSPACDCLCIPRQHPTQLPGPSLRGIPQDGLAISQGISLTFFLMSLSLFPLSFRKCPAPDLSIGSFLFSFV